MADDGFVSNKHLGSTEIENREHYVPAKAKKVLLVTDDGLESIAPLQIVNNLEGGGKVSVGVTAIEATFTGETKAVIITADSDNTGKLFVGKSNVTNAGANAVTFLDAGDTLTLDYDDATNAIYVVSDTASQNFWKGALL